MKRPRLSVKQIAAWADAYYARTGRWPTHRSGALPGGPGENWGAINTALAQGFRGLRGGSSLARMLAKHRGVQNRSRRPRLTIKQILAWADAHYERRGTWPKVKSGPVHGAGDENWRKIDNALSIGLRGLPGGSSLAKCLSRGRGVRNRRDVEILSIGLILAWADPHHRRTGRWPTAESGPVWTAPGETWSGVNGALVQGTRGLPGGSSLARFLGQRRGVRNKKDLPRLTIKQILAWADVHCRRTGRWPTQTSGTLRGSRGETWRTIDGALRKGTRGLPGGSSLSSVLDKYRRYVGLQ